MDTYSLLREIADSWVLLAMFSFFLTAAAWAFRPGSTRLYADASQIPLRDDELTRNAAPGDGAVAVAIEDEIDGSDAPAAKSCTGQCEACACAADKLKGLTDV